MKKVKFRWVSMPLDFRFYQLKKAIAAKTINVKQKDKAVPFESKMEQASTMLKAVQDFYQQPVLAVADSWFGNNGLWSKLEKGGKGKFNLPCCTRSNLTLFVSAPIKGAIPQAGHSGKYGARL